jgi:hypothetical protein
MTPWRIVMPDGYVVTPPPKRWLDAWDARVRAELGKPVLPVLDDLPAEVRAFVGTL